MNSKSIQSEIHDPDYRPINSIAILALVLALISTAALLNVLFVGIALLSIVLSVLAIRGAQRADRKSEGTGFAWVAIFIACLFVSISTSYYVLKHQHRWNTAQSYSDQWLQHLQDGNKNVVHHFTLPDHDRQPIHVDLNAYYATGEVIPGLLGRQPQTGFESYWRELYPQQLIIKDGHDCKIEFLRRESARKVGGKQLPPSVYRLVYRYTPKDPKLKQIDNVGRERNTTILFPLEFEVWMRRMIVKDTNKMQWYVFQVKVNGLKQSNEERQVQ